MAISKSSRDVLSGTAGGITQVLVGQPFDIVKVRLQTAVPGTYTGIGDCAGQIWKKYGFRGFYSGTLTPLLGVGACVSIQFGVVGAGKRLFQQKQDERYGKGTRLTNGQLYTSGALAGIANSFVAGPVEHIRIRLQAQQERVFTGPLDCARKITAQSGITGLFRGMTATIIREGHGAGIYFLTYEYLVQRTLNGRPREELSNVMAMLFGASAGVALWLSAYPIDVVKSRMQTDAIIPSKRAYPSTLHCIRSIWQTAGLQGFLRGLTPTLVRAPFANAATFVAYEMASRELNKYVVE
ncbi:putative YMC1-protein of the mitochondrial carrier family [Meira miltonrushii]|uniref:Putative YMC1-protein of the mitochondrial carrier family n=1 Tax=Meira miltonrushii TaxID=1280837 RepID=A0A316VLC8_9BASI|nr:putative YMC1-protein of the mitochondrial carrier family [Meira miltonrushii]PWN37173.1 putative YMC1-protein of the mitochondrial carrier family [Meira miltonrushii]